MQERNIMRGRLRTMLEEHGKKYYQRFSTVRNDTRPISFYYTISIPNGLLEVVENVVELSKQGIGKENEYMEREFFMEKEDARHFSPKTIFDLRRIAWFGIIDLFESSESLMPYSGIALKGIERLSRDSGVRKESGIITGDAKACEGIRTGTLNYGKFPGYAVNFKGIAMDMQDFSTPNEHNIRLYTKDEIKKLDEGE